MATSLGSRTFFGAAATVFATSFTACGLAAALAGGAGFLAAAAATFGRGLGGSFGGGAFGLAALAGPGRVPARCAACFPATFLPALLLVAVFAILLSLTARLPYAITVHAGFEARACTCRRSA